MSEAFADRLPTFFDLFSQGKVRADLIDDYVDAWHDAHETQAKQVPLHEYLGLAWPEYQVWACDVGALPAILEARRSAAPLVDVIAERLDHMKAAGRPTDGTTIVALASWLKHCADSGADAQGRSRASG